MDVNEAEEPKSLWDQLLKKVKASLPGCPALERSYCLCGDNLGSPIHIGSSAAPRWRPVPLLSCSSKGPLKEKYENSNYVH